MQSLILKLAKKQCKNHYILQLTLSLGIGKIVDQISVSQIRLLNVTKSAHFLVEITVHYLLGRWTANSRVNPRQLFSSEFFPVSVAISGKRLPFRKLSYLAEAASPTIQQLETNLDQSRRSSGTTRLSGSGKIHCTCHRTDRHIRIQGLRNGCVS